MVGVFGTIDSPSSKGYPNATFSITPNGGAVTYFNETGSVTNLTDPEVVTARVQLFKSKLLSLGNYTLTITTDGIKSPSFYFDFITVQLPNTVATPVERVIADDDNGQWRYNDRWPAVAISKRGNYLDTIHQIHGEGLSAIFPFQGTDITVYGTFGGGNTLFSDSKPLGYFQIDSGDNHTVVPSSVLADLTYKGASRHQMIYSAQNLSPGHHTLTVIPYPDHGRVGDATWFIDYAIYGPASPDGSNFTLPLSTPVPSPSPSPSPHTGETGDSNPSSPPPGAIAGGVIGIVVLAMALAAVLLWKKKRRQNFVNISEVKNAYPLDGSNFVSHTTPGFTSETELPGRMPSMHKVPGRAPQQPLSHRLSGWTETSLNSGTVMRSLIPETPERRSRRSVTMVSWTERNTTPEPEVERPINARPRREVDGGVRLGDEEEALPPSYAHYR